MSREKYMHFIASFMAVLVLTIPFYTTSVYASISKVSAKGADGVEGFAKSDDFVSLSVVASISGDTITNNQVVLGIEQMATENHRPIAQFLERLVERGLRYDEGILFIIDGSKGIRKAIEEVFPLCGVIHRCHYHKTENVVSYLPKGLQMVWRAKLRAAYRQNKHEAAMRALEKLAAELHDINPSAEASLREGLEETLSLHKLGLYAELGKSLASTNCIESVMSQLGQYTDKVDRWRGGSHIQRWAAAGLLALEPRLQKMRGYRYLKLLRVKLQEEITKRQKIQALGSATINDLAAGIHQSIPEN